MFQDNGVPRGFAHRCGPFSYFFGGTGFSPWQSMPVSRRALLSAFFPSAPAEGADPGACEQPGLVATISTTTICVERHGVSCRRCAEVCEHSAVQIMARERRGAVVDAKSCTGCGDCVPVCPVGALAMLPRERVELASEVARLVAGHG